MDATEAFPTRSKVLGLIPGLLNSNSHVCHSDGSIITWNIEIQQAHYPLDGSAFYITTEYTPFAPKMGTTRNSLDVLIISKMGVS